MTETARSAHGARVVWDEAFTAYDFGPTHPMAPIRVELAIRLAEALGVLTADGVTVGPAPGADVERLRTVHEAPYIAAVQAAGADPSTFLPERGLGTTDNPVFPRMHEASALVAGASVAAAEAVWSGAARHAANIAGGLHHAMPGAASGFCVYNDAALAIARLLELGARRVAYVDVDVHHGDGVQHVFYDDPRVLTISLHESPRVLFPGTGNPEETGGPDAVGSAVNVALPPGTGDMGWLRAFHAVVPPLLAAWQPEVLVSQHGCDTHYDDPLAHLMVTLDGQRLVTEAVHRLAEDHAGGRWVALGGGGYAVVSVVPRAWSLLLGQVAHAPVAAETEIPQEWRELARERTGQVPPVRMTDGRDPVVRPWSLGIDPDNGVDRAVLATRKAVFPEHGLDPYDPYGARA